MYYLLESEIAELFTINNSKLRKRTYVCVVVRILLAEVIKVTN